MDFKDFWNIIRSLRSHLRKQYLRVGGFFRNNSHLFGWNYMDFKDFGNNNSSPRSHLRKWYLRDGGTYWNNPNLFGWNYMDFKDFWNIRGFQWSHLLSIISSPSKTNTPQKYDQVKKLNNSSILIFSLFLLLRYLEIFIQVTPK